jgi:deoxyadenosine/deoxycytidine kinase
MKKEDMIEILKAEIETLKKRLERKQKELEELENSNN